MTTVAERASAGAQAAPRTDEKSHFRTDVEGLRAMIATMVVAHHDKWLVFGGVDMSLALSGYLGVDMVVRHIKERIAKDGRVTIDFWRFYARRARRMLPLAAVVIIATIAMGAFLPAFKQKALAWDAIAAAGSAINFRLALGATDYFTDNTSAASPLQHYWSLAVEEQYWLFLPILLVGAMWVINKLRLGLWALAVMLGGLAAVSLVLSVVTTADSQPWAYFGPQTRAWELAIGGLTAIGVRFFTQMWKPLAALMGWAGGPAIAYGSVEESHTAAIPGWIMVWSVAGVCMVIAAGCAKPKYGPALILSLPPIRFVGRASYGWYLWHWPCLIIAPYVVGRQLSLVEKVAVSLGALVLAIVTYWTIECPIKGLGELIKFPKQGVMFGLRFAIAAALAGMVLLTGATVQASTGMRTVEYADAAQLSQLVAQSTQINNLPAAANAEMGTIKDVLFTECLASETDTVAQPCYKGDYTSHTDVVLLGSSVAWQWLAPLDTIAKEHKVRLVIFTKGLCAAERYDIEGDHTAACNTWRQDAYNKIAALHPAVVIMSSHVGIKATPDAIRSSVAYFRDLGAKVLTLGETPRFDWDVPECLSTHPHDIQQCSVSVTGAFRENRELIVMQQAAVQDGGGTFLSPLPWMCTDRCSPVVGKIMVYRDQDHLSPDFVIWITRVMEAALPQLD